MHVTCTLSTIEPAHMTKCDLDGSFHQGAMPNLYGLHMLSTTGQVEPSQLFKPNILFNPYIKHSITQTSDIEQTPGPIENRCHICNNEVDTQHELQCENCDTWLYSN